MVDFGEQWRRTTIPSWKTADDNPHLTVVGGDNKKSLYLCFGEYKLSGDVVYSIQVTNLREDVSEVGYEQGKQMPVHMGCGVYEGKILFVGGVESIYDGIEEWDFAQHPTTNVSAYDPGVGLICRGMLMNRYRSLRGGKVDPIIREHDRKLFVLSTYPMRFAGVPVVPAFEVFDPKERAWKNLPHPPPFEVLYHQRGIYALFSYLNLGSNIFVSSGLSTGPHSTGPLRASVFRFNLADPHKGWQPHAFVDCHRLPLDFTPRSVAVECDGGDWVIFTYNPSSPNLPVYLISKDLTSLKPIGHLKLPFAPSDLYGKRFLSYHSFFIIGGQKVGLVVAVDENGKKNDPVEEKVCAQFAEDPSKLPREPDVVRLKRLSVGDAWRKLEPRFRPIMIYVVTFEFELQSGKNGIAFKDLDDVLRFWYDAGDRPRIKSGNSEVEMVGALWL